MIMTERFTLIQICVVITTVFMAVAAVLVVLWK